MINKLAILLFLLIPLNSQARIADLDQVAFEAAKFSCNRDPGLTPLIPCDEYTGRAAFTVNVRIIDILYWKNYIHTEAVESTVKTVGWHYEGGINIVPGIQLYYEHHSRHVMDRALPNDGIKGNRFPVENSVGVRFNFYLNPNPAKSLFGN